MKIRMDLQSTFSKAFFNLFRVPEDPILDTRSVTNNKKHKNNNNLRRNHFVIFFSNSYKNYSNIVKI